MQTVLALDIGDRRIGIAGSDALGLTAQPVATLVRKGNDENTAREISRIAHERGAEVIVAGLPLNMDGTAGFQAQSAIGFGRTLGKVCEIPVRLIDERLTTRAAGRALSEGGARRQKRKEVIDRLAAAYILETYLAAPGMARELEEFE